MNKIQGKANWTILVYANGNNELEPEMWQAKLLAEKIGSNEKVHVLLQLGREERKLVNIFRPDTYFPIPSESWTGVRRYLVNQGSSVLQKDIGKVTMAHPEILYDFLKWAMSQYPAEQFMLILGGHGWQFVGAMTDYSQNKPYLMSIPGMSQAINMACNELGCKIDILVLDICYFNCIEVLYEVGKDKDSTVNNVLTYIINGPINGLPVDQLIEVLQHYPNHSPRKIIYEIIDRIPLVDLVAFEINHSKLESIKQGFNQLASTYLTNSDREVSLNELLAGSNPSVPWYPIAKDVINQLQTIVIHHKRSTDSRLGLIYIANQPTSNIDRIALYSKLAFARNNNWTYLLSNKIGLPKLTSYTELQPTVLSKDALYAYISIMNPQKTIDEKIEILNTLVDYKGWSW